MGVHLISGLPAGLHVIVAEEVAPERSDTFLGLGLIAVAVLVVWLLRSSRT